jgi:SOUL heme-binding protein
MSKGSRVLKYEQGKQVVEKERRLRAALLLDGLKPEEGYRLARYNDPFTPPPIRRNEILIKLESFDL